MIAVPVLYFSLFFAYIRLKPYFVFLQEENLPNPRQVAMTFSIIFEVIIIILSILMFNKIAKSIHFVEKEANKLSDGDVDKPLSIPTNRGYANEITNLLTHLEEFRKVFKQRKNEQNRFVMGLSHDLKTPIAIIKGYAEGISDGLLSDPKKQKEALRIILLKTTQLETMVDDMVSFIKMNESDWTKNFVEYDLGEYLETVEKYISNTGSVFNRNITSEMKVPRGIKIKMDKQLVSRALENIFSNAVRYTEDGGVISLNADLFADKAQIKIADTGIGMTQEDAGHVFELFYRGTHSRREQGQGIGLSVVKTVMDVHGWDIDVESKLGKGTAFIITIPLKQTAKA